MIFLYITDRVQFPGDESARQGALLAKIAEAARCGVDLVQLREKDLPIRELEILARAAVRVVRENSPLETEKRETRLLINSRTDVAITCGADGVHLRSKDISPSDVQEIWLTGRQRTRALVSVSCHSAVEVARAAFEGADFALFAPVFEKKDVTHSSAAGLDALREASQQKIPVLALGGVTVENARACLDAGAAGIAGIRLFQENDIAEVVRHLKA
ncbi:MAG TPA: thiamine phosphate synthase [Terriglobales bacterium]|nr:thiamine phosphate synthase [Terriglobales bacterium]